MRDPFKRLGISKEASEEEIQAARNFLMIKYAGHKPSLDAIELAHDKIIMQSFHDRRKPKLHIKKRIREVSQSRVITAITSRFVTPSTNFVIKTAILFALLGVLTVLFPTEEGPTLQVAISLIATMYFVHSRLKSWLRASLYGYCASSLALNVFTSLHSPLVLFVNHGEFFLQAWCFLLLMAGLHILDGVCNATSSSWP